MERVIRTTEKGKAEEVLQAGVEPGDAYLIMISKLDGKTALQMEGEGRRLIVMTSELVTEVAKSMEISLDSFFSLIAGVSDLREERKKRQ